MALPTGQLTRAQIVDPALRRAGNTKATVRADAIVALNDILYDLYTQFEWPFLHTDLAVTLTGSAFTLPADFQKAVDDAGLLITAINADAVRQVVLEVPREQLVVRQPTSGVPQIWHPDRALGLGLLWPQSTTQTISALLRYKRIPDALTLDSEMPVFPWHRYLQQAIYVWALTYEMDPRVDQEQARLDTQLKRLLEIANPLRSQASVIPLDPTVFGPVFEDEFSGSW